MSESEEQRSSARPRRNDPLQRENLRFAHRLIPGTLPARLAESLKTLSQDFDFSLRRGELQLLNNSWYVTHTGLLRLARRKRCRGIHVEAVDSLCDSAANRFVLKATVYPSKDSAGFVGYGDADPSNVSLLVRGAEMRIAETRAVNRALRKAYGIGICSVEEIGSNPGPTAGLLINVSFHPKIPTETGTAMVVLGTRSAIGSAKSSASTSSIPSW